MSDTKGRFGVHGGQYIPETLMNAVIELEEAYNKYKDDEKNVYTKTLIHYLCETEIREQARKTTLKPSQKKRIKAIEKFHAYI